MFMRSLARTAAILVPALVPAVLFAAPECDVVVEVHDYEVVPFDGRHYQVVKANGISWDTAKGIAECREYNGVRGHLATLTSQAEDEFVEGLREDAPLSRPEVWAGGFQNPCTEQPGCGWQWVNGEGPISAPAYSNWQSGEPNNLGGKEKHLGIGHRGEFGWNDEGNLGNIGGYVVEYDTSSNVSVIECTGPNGCPTTDGQVLQLPPGVDPDGSIGIRTYEFEDPRVYSEVAGHRCGEKSLTLFSDRGADQELRIPAYLCGSPKFLVVEVDTEGFEVQQGTILVNNEPTLALGGNWYECDGLVTPQPTPAAPLSAEDPQGRDVVVWQTTNPADMLESGPLAGSINPGFVGALGEFTFECGSSRGKIKSASYYVIGMHINFGPGYDVSTNHDRFVELTRYKLLLLRASVIESRPALNRVAYAVLRVLVDSTIKLHDRGRFDAALVGTKLFLRLVESFNYATIPGENYNGEHLMRGSNLEFMYLEKVLPFAP